MSGGSSILALPEIGYDEDEDKLKKDEKVKLEKLGGFFNPTETPDKPEEGEAEYEEEKGEEYGKIKKKKEDDEEEPGKVVPPTRVLGNY